MSTEIDTFLNSARQARSEQRLQDAKGALLEALEHCRRADAKGDLALTLKALGQIERDMGNPEIALPLYEEAVTIYRDRDQDQPLALAHTIRHVADILQDMGRGELADPAYREALAIYRAHPEASALDLANTIRGLAILSFDSGKNDEAKALWQEARELYGSANVQAGVNESSRRLALLASR
jgi:tetratricopeptide (TPR) repeat protein